nr:MAG TPA: hypothetical protein [Caudoviricetes sp.]
MIKLNSHIIHCEIAYIGDSVLTFEIQSIMEQIKLVCPKSK